MHARLVSVAETLERYSAAVYDEDCFISASRDALGPHAMDLRDVPACSRREYAQPGFPLAPADPSVPIRWNIATDLLTGDDVLVPAVMTYLVQDRQRAEAFWLPISTGCAIHFDPVEALFGAICEVVERDALSLAWLQKLPLPLLADDCVPDIARCLISWAAERHIETFLFDATTDIGIPTVYCLQVARHTSRAAQMVGCATELQVKQAVTKAVMECMGLRALFYERPWVPRSYREYRGDSDVAAAMARASRRRAFGFLLDGADERPRSRPECECPGTPRGRLDFVLSRLARYGMTPYQVDITPDDVRALGLTSYRVIIPALQPMSLHPLVRFGGHRRLFTAPARMGFPVRPESRLNRWPQPMS